MNDKSQRQTIDGLVAWFHDEDRSLPIKAVGDAIAAYQTLQSQLTQANSACAAAARMASECDDKLKATEAQLTQAKSERDMANAGWAALKMCAQAAKGSEAFEKCFLEIVQLSGHGQALLERMKEAEWLLSRPLLATMSKQSELTEYHRRYDAFQKGGVK